MDSFWQLEKEAAEREAAKLQSLNFLLLQKQRGFNQLLMKIFIVNIYC